MKKTMQYVLLAVMILSAVFTVWLPIYIWPKEVVTEFEGVMFVDGDPAITETVSIKLNGHLNKRMFGGERYLGKIVIDEMEPAYDGIFFKPDMPINQGNWAKLGKNQEEECIDYMRQVHQLNINDELGVAKDNLRAIKDFTWKKCTQHIIECLK